MKRLLITFTLSSLTIGTVLVIISNHWFPIWLGLELRTLSVIPLLKTKINSRRKEATIKYFLVQAFRAALLLNGATLSLWIKNSWSVKEIFKTPICYLIILLAIIIKLGLSPCHFWFPDVLRGVSFLKGIIIACWQKIAPLFVLLELIKKIPKEIVLVCAAMSVLIGGWGGLNQVRVRKILAYSSIRHLGWITATLFFIPEIAILLFILYILKNTLSFLICHNKNLTSLSNLRKIRIIPTTSILFSLTLLSLGGLPPLGGFLKKLIPFLILIENLKRFLIPIFIIGSLIRLYFYLRIVFKTRLTLFPKNSLTIIYSKTSPPNKTNLVIRILTPFTIWGLLLFPIIWSFI